MVNNALDIYTIIKENSNQLQNYGVIKLGLFGSFVRSDNTSNSDIDLLVEFAKGKKSFKNYMATANFAEKKLGRKVDLITIESLSPHIAPHILKEVQYVQIAS
jgi:predicted nucleotidyltransferase